MSARVYVEGGGDSKDLKTRCREGFSKLFERAGLKDRMPKIVASGSRGGTFDDFKTALSNQRKGAFIALLVDSEDPVDDPEKPWDHLAVRDGWKKPTGATDEQARLMVTCMETWIVADRPTLKAHYKQGLSENRIPKSELEARKRGDIQDALVRATANCSNAYSKGRRSFEVLGKLDPAALEPLVSFKRVIKILRQVCK